MDQNATLTLKDAHRFSVLAGRVAMAVTCRDVGVQGWLAVATGVIPFPLRFDPK